MAQDVSDEDIRIAMEKLTRANWAKTFNHQSESQRLNNARKSARELGDKRRGLNKNWEHTFSMPMHEYYFLQKKYGPQAMSDPGFRKWLHMNVLKPQGMSYAKSIH